MVLLSYCADDYRYGFNGMEYDDEIQAGKNSYTTEFRQYDPRLGRWKSMDPVKHHQFSPYNAMDNNPVHFSDPLGADGIGDASNGTLKAQIYFIADPLSSLTQDQMITYLGNFINNVSATWTTMTFNGQVVNLNDVEFMIISDASEVLDDCNIQNIITVGNGESLDQDSPQAREGISFVDGEKNDRGYFFFNGGNPNYADHEFGHIFGLSDRYHEVWRVVEEGPTGNHNPEYHMLFNRTTIPMDRRTTGIDKETDYLSNNNLMSGTGGRLTRNQMSIIFSNSKEKNYRTVTFIVNPKRPQPYSSGLVKGLKKVAFDAGGNTIDNSWYVDKTGYYPKGGLLFDMLNTGKGDPTDNKRRNRNNRIVSPGDPRGSGSKSKSKGGVVSPRTFEN